MLKELLKFFLRFPKKKQGCIGGDEAYETMRHYRIKNSKGHVEFRNGGAVWVEDK